MFRSLPTLLLLLLAAGLTFSAWLGPLPSKPVAVQLPTQPKVDLAKRVEPTLAWTDAEATAAVERQLAHLARFFAEARGRTPKFAEGVLGWGSKWRFVVDKVPYTKGDRHAEFLRKVFAEQLFSDKELTQAIEQIARGYADSLTDVENQMLVRLRQDVVGLPVAELPQFQDVSSLQTAYGSALKQAQTHVGASVNGDVASLVMSLVVQEVVTQVAVRLGVSAGVLGVGAGSSWATLGVGLVVGVIVDQMIGWVWDAWADPQGQLALDMNKKLSQLERMIIEGDEKSPGLRTRLLEFSRQRAEQRRYAIHQLLKDA
jgi:hypothetical protein